MNHVTETKKLNNKGFSLVELIIVIAIMAVLIGVLAPQYLKYVEKSRESADLDNYEVILTGIETYAANPEAVITAGETIVCTKGNAVTVAAGSSIETALKDSGVNYGAIKMKSEKYGKATITVTNDNGYLKFTCDNDKLLPALGR